MVAPPAANARAEWPRAAVGSGSGASWRSTRVSSSMRARSSAACSRTARAGADVCAHAAAYSMPREV